MESGREFYRVTYPVMESPTLIVEGEQYVILDVSEKGLCTCEPIPGLQVGTEIVALLQLFEADPVPVEGHVVRIADDAVAIHFDKRGVAYNKIIKEQQRLIQKYPAGLPE